ncbi:MAG: hypothetical protein ACRELF_10330, partial [Gemmataceae bacterium]
ELADFRESLTPFSDHPLKRLTDLLVQADAAAQGEPSLGRGGGSKGARKGGSRKKDKPDPATMASEVRALYERAADPAVTEADVNALMARLEPMGKDGLLSVAAAIELKVAKSKNMDYIIGEIRKRILARKSASQRSSIIDRHGEHKTVIGEDGGMARQDAGSASNVNGAD